MLVDGDHHQIDRIRTEATRRGAPIHLVIDLIHVLEYLWRAARCLHEPDDPAAEQRVAAWALGLLAGSTSQVITTLDSHAAALPASSRGGLNAALRYLTGHRDHLHYDQALAAGWPIATGVIEGTCRHLINDRLDITGARWGLPGAEAILKLRALISNGDLDVYWTFHLDREHEVLHSHNRL